MPCASREGTYDQRGAAMNLHFSSVPTQPDKLDEALRTIERQAKTIEDLLQALETVNTTIFANTIRLGSPEYFSIRNAVSNAITKARGA